MMILELTVLDVHIIPFVSSPKFYIRSMYLSISIELNLLGCLFRIGLTDATNPHCLMFILRIFSIL